MEVVLRKEEAYAFETKRRIFSGFKVISEWEGFKKLADGDGRVVIISDTSGIFTEIVGNLCGYNTSKVRIVSATPDFIAELKG